MRIKRVSTEILDDKTHEVDLSPADGLFKQYEGKKNLIIPLLQKIQELYGFLPVNAIVKTSEVLHVNLSVVYGVATFYSQFRLTPVGKYMIKICHGTACHVQNAPAITEAIEDYLKIKDGQTTQDGLFTIESVACLGCCSLAPVMMINSNTHGLLTKESVVGIINSIREKESLKQE